MLDERFDELSLRYLDGLLAAEELAEFSKRLRDEEDCRDDFVGFCVHSALLVEQQGEAEITPTGVLDWPGLPSMLPRGSGITSLGIGHFNSRLTSFVRSIVSWFAGQSPMPAIDSRRHN